MDSIGSSSPGSSMGSSAPAASSRPDPAPSSSASSSPSSSPGDSSSISSEARSGKSDTGGVSGLTDGLKANYSADKPGLSGPKTGEGGGSEAEGATKAGGASKAETATKDFEALAEGLRKGSPTAAAALDEFKKAGGKIEDGGKAGYYIQGTKDSPPRIGIPTEGRDQTGQRGVLAHELGHRQYDAQGKAAIIPPSRDGGGITDSQIEARREHNFITQNTNNALADEAYATRFNATVRDEAAAAGAPPVGVTGYDSGPFKRLPAQDRLIDDIAGAAPSTRPDSTYRGYYNDHNIKTYQDHYAPGRE